MLKFDPLLDFYDPTGTKEALQARHDEMLARADKILASFKIGLTETGPSPFSRFGKSFELIYTSGDLNKYLDELYSGDFVFMDASYFPLLEEAQFELFLFLLLADREGVLWHYRTPIINPYLPKFYSGMGYYLYESKRNMWGKEFRFLDIHNYKADK